MNPTAAAFAAFLASAALLAGAAPSALAHTESAKLGDLPVLQYDPEVAVLVPGETVEKKIDTVNGGRLAWWTVVLCHCEQFRIWFNIAGPPNLVSEEFLITPPTYHHYALYWVHWDGATTLSWKNVGNKTVVIEFRAGPWVDPPAAPPAPASGAGPALEIAALAGGAGALGAAAWWWPRKPPQADTKAAGRRAHAPRQPPGPGALVTIGLALTLAAAGVGPISPGPATGADGPPMPSRAAPPPEANLTVVKIQAPNAFEVVTDTVTVRGVAYVNETEAARIGMPMTLERVFLSFDFGPFEPAVGVAQWTFSWNTTPFNNGYVWVGAAALDSMGNYTYDWIKVYVSNGAHPVANASAAPARGYAPLNVSFTGSATDADGSVAALRWDFGDGGSAEGASVNHTFAVPGMYRVVLVAVDNRGTQGRAFLNVTVLDPAGRPQCTPSARVQQGPEALTVSFTGMAFDDGTVVSAQWDFGDGSQAAGFNATHTYASAGNFTVALTVLDDEGNAGRAQLSITVPEPLRLRTDFPNLRGTPAAPDFRGVLEVFTAVPSGKRVAVILPPLRPGDTIEWRFAACACAGLQNLSFWVESPSGERLLAVGVSSASALVVGWNALNVTASGVYQLVWENAGPGDAEIGYTVRTTTAARGEGAGAAASAVGVLAAGVWAAAAGVAGVGVLRRRALRERGPAGRGGT